MLVLWGQCYEMIQLPLQHRASHVHVDMGWVDFDFCVPPTCPAAYPLWPNSHQPKQSRADIGTLEIQVHKTKATRTWDALYILRVDDNNCGLCPHFRCSGDDIDNGECKCHKDNRWCLASGNCGLKGECTPIYF